MDGPPASRSWLGPPSALEAEQGLLPRVERAAPTAFVAPHLFGHGIDGGWGWLLMTAPLSGRTRTIDDPDFPGIAADLERIVADPRAATPTHWRPMHGDLSPWNLRRTRAGTVLVDWENAGWGPPHADEVRYRSLLAGARRRAAPSVPVEAAEAVAFWRNHGSGGGTWLQAEVRRVLTEMAEQLPAGRC